MKTNIKILLLLLLACSVGSVIILAQKQTGEETISAGQVREAIQVFSKLVNDQNAKDFGLQNAAQLQSLRAGKQFKKYMIGLDDVRKFKTGDKVEPLIKELPSIEVSLTDANGRVVSSIEFIKNKESWQASGFGSTPDFKALFIDERSTIADSLINKGTLVRIPALHTSFIAVSASSGLNFIVLQDNESLGFRRGQMIQASEAISKLTPVANAYNGLPD